MVLIKGLNKTCLIDFEPYTSCVIFLGGCNFRCGYCHNPDLVINLNNAPTIREEEVLSFLDTRKNWLDGVVISGGEPTLHNDLPSFISKIKEKGYLVKLDTNGINPDMLRMLIEKRLIDYVAMDIKTSLDEYENVTCVKLDINRIKESIDILKNSGIAYEFRTTMVPGLVTKENVFKIAEMLSGSRRYVLQNFREKVDMIETRFKNIHPYKKEDLEALKEMIKDKFDEVRIR